VSNRLRLAALLLVLGSLAACGPSSEQASPPSSAEKQPAVTPAAASPATSPAIGGTAQTPKLLDFTAPKLGGGQVVGSELAGHDVAIFFWAPW
jgi:hypothetical protein